MDTQFTSTTNTPADYPADLIEGCRRGDQKAQLRVYRLYYKPVFATCLRIVKDRDLAEEVMHESFLLAFEEINSYLGDISFPVWVRNFIKQALKYENKN